MSTTITETHIITSDAKLDDNDSKMVHISINATRIKPGGKVH